MARLTQAQKKANLVADLIRLQHKSNTEVAHVDADNLLLAFIDDSDVTAAYDAIDKWYA